MVSADLTKQMLLLVYPMLSDAMYVPFVSTPHTCANACAVRRGVGPVSCIRSRGGKFLGDSQQARLLRSRRM